ncbi:hypothetical protein C5O18_10090, partial [Amnimonas aquatica]
DRYYVNKNAQPNGDHEVHKEGCFWMPNHMNLTYLGTFSSCREPVTAAKRIYPRANGCMYCARLCHTS